MEKRNAAAEMTLSDDEKMEMFENTMKRSNEEGGLDVIYSVHSEARGEMRRI